MPEERESGRKDAAPTRFLPAPGRIAMRVPQLRPDPTPGTG